MERRPSEPDVSLIPVLVPLPRPGCCGCQLVPRARQQAWPGTGVSGGGRLVFLSRAHRTCGAILGFYVLFCLRQKYILFFWLVFPGCLQGTWELSQERGKLLFSQGSNCPAKKSLEFKQLEPRPVGSQGWLRGFPQAVRRHPG